MIKLNNVSKTIKGHDILTNINYCFEKEMVYGLYGPNGSGKTMILRMLAGLIHPTEGTVEVDGKVLHKDISFPPSIGVIIENMDMLQQLTAFENLEVLAKIKKIATKDDILEALVRVGLNSDKPVKKYSLGMRQRLNIAQAIFEKPQLILLDEPTNALDENGIELIHKLIKEERSRGTCIVMATHNKNDLSMVCDKLLKVNEGHMEEMKVD